MPTGPTETKCTGGLEAKTPHPYCGDEGSTPSRCSEFFDNSASNLSAHDVAAACRLAMAEVRVRLPLGALVNVFFSGRGKAWDSACFGSRRSPVQIQPS